MEYFIFEEEYDSGAGLELRESCSGDAESYAVIGACMAVHRELGCGFLEAVYQESLKVEFSKMAIPNIPEKKIPVFYSGVELPIYYKADFVCFDSLILEIKALDVLTTRETSQVLNYLKATKYARALLVNFGEKSLRYRRFVGEGAYRYGV